MAKDKQQKKKERERRVAKKKLADAEKRAELQAEQQAEQATGKRLPRAKKIMTGGALPKTTYVPSNRKSPFTHRRSGG